MPCTAAGTEDEQAAAALAHERRGDAPWLDASCVEAAARWRRLGEIAWRRTSSGGGPSYQRGPRAPPIATPAEARRGAISRAPAIGCRHCILVCAGMRTYGCCGEEGARWRTRPEMTGSGTGATTPHPRARIRRRRTGAGSCCRSWTPSRDARVLDIGSGLGDLAADIAAACPGCALTGIEMSRSGVERSRELVPTATFLERDLLQPVAPDETQRGWATHAVCSEVLEHVDDPVALLTNARAYLAPGCRLVVTVPGGPMSAYDRHIGHRRHFTPRSLRQVLTQAGFAVDDALAAGFPFFNLYRLVVVARGRRLITDVAGGADARPTGLARIAMGAFGVLFQLNVRRTPFGGRPSPSPSTAATGTANSARHDPTPNHRRGRRPDRPATRRRDRAPRRPVPDRPRGCRRSASGRRRRTPCYELPGSLGGIARILRRGRGGRAPRCECLHLPARFSQAGCSVLVEKPLGTSGHEARALAVAAERLPMPSFVGYNYRFLPGIAATIAALEEGQFGRAADTRHAARPRRAPEVGRGVEAPAGAGGRRRDPRPGCALARHPAEAGARRALHGRRGTRGFWKTGIEEDAVAVFEDDGLIATVRYPTSAGSTPSGSRSWERTATPSSTGAAATTAPRRFASAPAGRGNPPMACRSRRPSPRRTSGARPFARRGGRGSRAPLARARSGRDRARQPGRRRRGRRALRRAVREARRRRSPTPRVTSDPRQPDSRYHATMSAPQPRRRPFANRVVSGEAAQQVGLGSSSASVPARSAAAVRLAGVSRMRCSRLSE